MGQTDEFMLHTRPSGGYMYTPIRRGHKPTPSQESNTLSEASCTTTLSVDSGAHLGPTYREDDEENRLDDFKDESLSASSEDLPTSSRHHHHLHDDGAADLPDFNSNLNSVIPPDECDVGNSGSGGGHNNHEHIRNNNNNKCNHNGGGHSETVADRFRKIPSDVIYIDSCSSDTSCSDRRSTLSSSVGEGGSLISSRFRDSCDTVIPACSRSSATSAGNSAAVKNNGIHEGKGSANSDYGSFCATPTDRLGGGGKQNSGNGGGGLDRTDNGILCVGDSFQSAPLLSDMGDNLSADGSSGPEDDRDAPVKINIPTNESEGMDGGSRSSIPHEPMKTFLSALFLATGFVATTTSLAITHEHVPEIAPLPDVILDNVTYTEWGLDVSEILIMISTMTAFLVVLLHSHRLIILRRIWFLLGCLYYYRAITMFITVLPKADPKYTCHPKLDNTTNLPALEIAKRVLILISGMGLSINGKHIYCGDYIFSGHTMVLTMGYLVIKEYSPRRFFLLHWMSFFTSVIGVVMLLIARGHYSIDCLIGYYITTRMWYIYHTLAHNNGLKSRGGHNFLDRMWWWLIFRYFEKNIPGPLPRRYSLPLPRPIKRFLRRNFRHLAQRWRSSRREQLGAGDSDPQSLPPPATMPAHTS